MARTMQPVSRIFVEEPKGQFSRSSSGGVNWGEPETEDNMSMLLSVYDSLNNLCVKLSALDYVMKRKHMEICLLQKGKEEQK